MRVVTLVAIGVALLACSETTVASRNGVTATLVSEGVNVANVTDRPLGVAAFDKEQLALLDWMMCVEPTSACLRLSAHGSLLIPFEQIGVDVRTFVVYTWAVVQQPDGSYRAEDVTTLELRR